MNIRIRTWRWYLPTGIIVLLLLSYLAWPLKTPFPERFSRCIYDCNGMLLRTTLAVDGQFRFRPSDRPLPDKYVKAVLAWEDRRFFMHPGIDPAAIIAAFRANIRNGVRSRGASTITMQLVRLASPHRRTYPRKLIECFSALRYNIHISKMEQLRLYAAHVPMGGNTVGIESASYRYFGAPVTELTWAQAALFAVLPNAPSSINIVKGRDVLRRKRNHLLQILMHQGCFDSLTLHAACMEPVPVLQRSLPFHAPHFCRHVLANVTGNTVISTLDLNLQEDAEAIMHQYHEQLAGFGIRNCAVLITDTKSHEVKAYIGSQSFHAKDACGQVDGVQAFRSPGSLLKPFLAACALDRGLCTMESMLYDIPSYYGNFTPMNATREYSGVTTVRQMLVQSLNIPAVRLLYEYGVGDFYDFLKNKAGLDNLFRTSSGYGLTLVLGGLETSLWELCGLFCTLANGGVLGNLQIDLNASPQLPRRILSDAATWLVLDALRDVRRPEAEFYRNMFSAELPVAWKTGTSYGQRDGWAIGCNTQWTIGVWVGNFTSEGNALISGARSAGPLLFALLRRCTDRDTATWFQVPEFDLKPVEVCAVSGFLPGDHCPEKRTVAIPAQSIMTKRCPIHRRFCLDTHNRYEVCSRCWDISDTVWRVKTVYLPSVMTVLRTRGYRLDTVPRHNPRCTALSTASNIVIEYPTNGLELQAPRTFSGTYEKIVLKAGCKREGSKLFWYVNNRYLGETLGDHRLAVDLPQDAYRLTIQDEDGTSASIQFRVWKMQ